MELKIVLGLTISQIQWMKMYFEERLIEIPKFDYKLEFRGNTMEEDLI